MPQPLAHYPILHHHPISFSSSFRFLLLQNHTAMVSLLRSTIPLSHHHSQSLPSSDSFYTDRCFLPRTHQNHKFQLLPKRVFLNSKKGTICRSTLDDEVTPSEPRPPPPAPVVEEESKPESIETLKIKLLSAVSGLNRGLAASEDDLRKADAAAKKIEAAGGLVDISGDLGYKLQGRWKLIYSSAFSSRTLGGSRPGPPTRRLLPITLGQVIQRFIQVDVISLLPTSLNILWIVKESPRRNKQCFME